MAYTKQTWTDDVSAVTGARMTHIEQGIYDNSLATDKINPSGTATTTAEIEEGQITDVIGFKSLKLKGQTSQYTTTGKNKYDLINATNQSGTIERTSDKTGFILRKGTNRINNWACSFPAGTYTIQFDLKLDNSTMSTQNLGFTPKDASQGNITSGNLFTGNGTKRYTFTATEDVAYLYFFINNSESSDCVATISNVMVMDGTISTNQDYEPYTGGKASPNPDFPQEVENVSGYNVVRISNKNLLKLKNESKVVSGTTIKISDTGTIELSGTSSEGIQNTQIPENFYLDAGTYIIKTNVTGTSTKPQAFVLYNGSTILCNITYNVGGNNATFTLSERTQVTRISFWVTSGTVNTNFKAQIQLEKRKYSYKLCCTSRK